MRPKLLVRNPCQQETDRPDQRKDPAHDDSSDAREPDNRIPEINPVVRADQHRQHQRAARRLQPIVLQTKPHNNQQQTPDERYRDRPQRPLLVRGRIKRRRILNVRWLRRRDRFLPAVRRPRATHHNRQEKPQRLIHISRRMAERPRRRPLIRSALLIDRRPPLICVQFTHAGQVNCDAP